MANESDRWGCCNNDHGPDLNSKYIKCSTCGEKNHYACLCLKESPNKQTRKTWKCPKCLSSTPKVFRSDTTPARNVTMNRGNKRQATDAPSPSPPSPPPNKEEIRSIVREIIKSEINEMLTDLNKNIASNINKLIEPMREEIQELVKSMIFFNERFEEIEQRQKTATETVKKLEAENTELRQTIGEMEQRINNLEQHSRSNNLELQCVPEKKHENLYSFVTRIGQVVKCEIDEKDIMHSSRIAKINHSSSRPRSVIVQLASPRLRDQLLAAIYKYNQDNPKDKLSTEHLGFPGQKNPIYVSEHLSPANKSLHAAARIKAKEMKYRYIWIRNGRIFVRKEDGAEHILIKNKNSLNKII